MDGRVSSAISIECRAFIPPFAGRREACFSGQNLATIGKQTDEYRTRNVEGRRRKSPRKGARRHEKSGSTDFELASLPSRIPLEFSRYSWLSDPSAGALLPSTFLVRYSAVPAVAQRRHLVDGFAARRFFVSSVSFLSWCWRLAALEGRPTGRYAIGLVFSVPWCLRVLSGRRNLRLPIPVARGRESDEGASCWLRRHRETADVLDPTSRCGPVARPHFQDDRHSRTDARLPPKQWDRGGT